MGEPKAVVRHGGVKRPFPVGPLHRELSTICSQPLVPEDIVPVRTAKVAVANYNALVHDFPDAFGADFLHKYLDHFCDACKSRRRLCENAIDQWLIANAAFVSAVQARPNQVNTKIDHGEAMSIGFRPPHYGRALILPVDSQPSARGAAFFDIKGAGVGPGVTPHQDVHANGLEYLGVALADFFYGWLLDRVFAHIAPTYQTVPVYAVLDLGFQIVDGAHGTAPAGLHVRRAHSRHGYGVRPPISGDGEERLALHMELILRRYGLTSTTLAFSTGFVKREDEAIEMRGTGIRAVPDGPKRTRFDQLYAKLGEERVRFANFQLTAESRWDDRQAQLVDLGHIGVSRRFSAPLATRVLDAFFQVGRIIMPNDRHYVQPDPRIALDHELFHRRTVMAIALQCAQDFATGRATQRDLTFVLARALRRAKIH